MAIKIAPFFAIHPGIWLREEIVDPHGLTVTDLARRNGLTAEMAIRFEKAFGLNAETLCRMQTTHELADARVRADDIKVERWREAA